MTINELSNSLEKQPKNIQKELDNFLSKVEDRSEYIVEDQLTDKGVELLALNQKGNIALKYRLWYFETHRTIDIWSSLKKQSFDGRDVLFEVVTTLEFPELKDTSLQVTKRLRSYVNLIDTLDVSIDEADLKVKERVEELLSVGLTGKDTFNPVKTTLLSEYSLKVIDTDEQ